MARPKKSEEVLIEENKTKEENFLLPVLSEFALGLHENKEKKTWELVILKFDVDSGESKIQEVKYVGTDRRVAVLKFKEMAVKLGVVK